MVLVELSRLVACARAASGAEGDSANPAGDLEALAKSARGVFSSVKRLFNLANECGVRLVQSQAARAASLSDIRAKAASPPPMPTTRAASAMGRARSPSIASTPMSTTFSSSSSSHSSPTSTRHGSMDSTTSSGSFEHTPVPPTVATFSGPQVHDSIGVAEDSLLSIIAAFIGHIHSHHMSSHPSSHANLIEMTRETIDAVRQVLTIVEAVGRHHSLQPRTRDIEQLRIAKDNLYDVASRLVEGAEAVANAPFSDAVEESYDQVKARLLQTATGTLRAGTECVRLVRLCVDEEESIHVTPRPAGPTHENNRAVPDSSLVLRDKVVGDRGPHTLSALHRKANSLSHLQRRYEADIEEDEEVVESRDEDVTLKPALDRAFPTSGSTPRSRSSSLTSPAPPRIQHRSPSRSADLDKFTSDFPLPVRPAYSRLNTFHTAADAPVIPSPRPSPKRSVTAPIPDVRFWVVSHDYDPKEIAFNSEGVIIGASLAVLVEKMTPHDVLPEHTFWQTFFYTFRLFSTPQNFLQTLIARYDLPAPAQVPERDRPVWIERKVVPVRLRIYNLLKAWLEMHWRSETDDPVLPELQAFISSVVSRTLPAMAPRLQSMIARKRVSSEILLTPTETTGGLPPTPIISRSLNSLLQRNPSSSSIPITDFDTLELARQLTLLESRLFQRVPPEELLQTGRKAIPELRALSTISNQITGWVADNVLNEQDAKKRAGLLKFYIKLADVSDTFRNSADV